MSTMELGIDSMSYYYGLTPKQKSSIMKQLKAMPDFRIERQDYFEQTYVYHSDCFAGQGVKLAVSQIKGSRWGLLVVVHPMQVLGESDRSKLYRPRKKEDYTKVVTQVDQILKQVKLPCLLDDMKLYRCDVTENRIFDDPTIVNEYIRILKKSCLLPCYSWDKFREADQKARDCKAANQHSCKQFCKSAAFFSYDKTAQLEMIEAFPDALIDKHILRLEAQLRRKAMKKWVGKDAMDSNNWSIIKKLSENVKKILKWYLKRLQPVKGDHLRYQDAVETVSQVKGKKMRERMLYLLRKTSDSDALNAALEKLCKKYGLSKNQKRTVLKKFEKLGISPITLANTSSEIQLPGIRKLGNAC